MLGAILGDVAGSPYEFEGIKSKDFPFISNRSRMTDDSFMTIAVALGLMNGERDPQTTENSIKAAMLSLGNAYPAAGYGGRFINWLKSENPQPYNSYGNGSAMRVSPVAWCFDTLEEVEEFARISAEITHNHPEGIKGAQATASAIFLARTESSKGLIRAYITERYGYDLTRTLDEIRPSYDFDVSCQGSVPEAIIAFLESTDFEDAIRNAVSLGGDSDTQGAIAGSIAEGFYGIDDELEDIAIECVQVAGLSYSDWLAFVART